MVAAAGVLLLGLAGCAGSAGVDEALAGRTFVSESVVRDGAAAELVDGTQISLEFSDEGWLAAYACCNTLFADVSTGGGTLEATGLGTTDMGCGGAHGEQDQWLTDPLDSSPDWTLEGDRLTLTAGTTEVVLMDRRLAEPGRPVEGIRWVVNAVIRAQSSETVPEGTEGSAWLMIENGRFTAGSGCRDIEGTVTVTGGRMLFGDAVHTPDCAVTQLTVDTVLARVVTGAIEFYFLNEQLILEHPDGVGLILLAER
jgi:heat shock protein HslJ